MISRLPYLLFFLVLFVSCNKDEPEFLNEVNDQIELNPSAWYFNSFETAADLVGIEGYAFQQEGSTVSGGGDYSLYICGGCIGPHCSLDVEAVDQERTIQVNFWAKSDVKNGGSLTVRLSDGSFTSQHISIGSEEWAYYEMDEPMVVPADQPIHISIMSGGFAPINSYVDLLQVVDAE